MSKEPHYPPIVPVGEGVSTQLAAEEEGSLAGPGILTWQRVFRTGLPALLVLAGIAFVVGHFAARAGAGFFDWELASIFGTALGTTALAVTTAALAFTTSGDARATWELARLTRMDQMLRERPILVMQEKSFESEGLFEGVLVVRVRNVGLGPALRVSSVVNWLSISTW